MNCQSYDSLGYGTVPLDELVELVAELGVKILGLTYINTVMGIYDCETRNIKPIVGIDFSNSNQILNTGLARNTKGIGEICEFLTEHNLSDKTLTIIAPRFKNTFIV
ncbi:MAG TPA: hypothetical protein ENH60_02240 [Pricia sp.]|uniref:Uncharacterized protein n=1 Tax=Pricia antarctica TaxID=641691 RepID=A0A831VQC9_9FLAO|nr:hypothetical protein [Pricia sp.]HEA22816.1 hypothetical protein [Pricia antarctica]